MIRAAVVALALGAGAASQAQAPAEALLDQELQRLQSAARLSYSATLVIASGNRLDSLQLGPGAVAAESARPQHDDGALRLEEAGGALDLPQRPWFERGAAPTLQQLQQGYAVELRPLERVDGREALVLNFEPRDRWRYGATLWLDRATGLVLKTELRDTDRRPLEQTMLVRLEVHGERAAPAAAPAVEDTGRWQVLGLPDGFAVTRVAREQEAEQLLVSDGLAAISVFVEPLAPGTPPQRGQQQRDLLASMAEVRGDFQLVAVGAVPPQTIERVLSGVRPR